MNLIIDIGNSSTKIAVFDRSEMVASLNSREFNCDKVEKLLMSAIANWQAKNEGVRIEEHPLVVSRIMVDSGRILKRLRPAPQGRGHRIRKRSNHVTIYVDQKNEVVEKVN